MENVKPSDMDSLFTDEDRNLLNEISKTEWNLSEDVDNMLKKITDLIKYHKYDYAIDCLPKFSELLEKECQAKRQLIKLQRKFNDAFDKTNDNYKAWNRHRDNFIKSK